MNFVAYDVNKYKNLKKLKNIKPSFFKREENASIFLYNEQANGLVHLILKLNDEYLMRTKLYTEYASIPFNHYINIFFSTKNSNLFIEESLSVYLKVAIEFLEKESNVDLSKKQINNKHFVSLTEKFKDKSEITRLEYLDYETQEDKNYEFISNLDFSEIIKRNISIEFVNWRFKNFYASLNKNGKLKLDNSNDEFLIKWLEEFSNEM